jgi:hypothetical protein
MDTKPKLPRSFNLSEECMRLIVWLAAHLGINQTAVVEMAVREYAKAKDFCTLTELSPFAKLLAKELHIGVENAEFARTAAACGVRPLVRK